MSRQFPPLRIAACIPTEHQDSSAITRMIVERLIRDDNRAVLEINPDADVYAQHSAARYAAGTPLSMFDGLPILIKDNIDTTDSPTTAGSPALKGNISKVDSQVWIRLKN